MIEDGLFERFPLAACYGLHNWPGLAVDEAAVHGEAVMASFDLFSLELSGQGCHAGLPHTGVDVILATCQLVNQLQALVSRETAAHSPAVLSITSIHAGDTYNVMPGIVRLQGSLRCLDEQVRAHLEARLRQAVQSLADFHRLTATLDYRIGYPPTINDPVEADHCAAVLQGLLGDARTHRDLPPSMAAEDFSFMLQETPGAYVWLGNGRESPSLHHPCYDFNDELLLPGVAYWVALADQLTVQPASGDP